LSQDSKQITLNFTHNHVALAPSNNGGKTEHYSWTQTLKEVNVNFNIPEGTNKKEIKVEFGKSTLKVTIKGTVVVNVRSFIFN